MYEVMFFGMQKYLSSIQYIIHWDKTQMLKNLL